MTLFVPSAWALTPRPAVGHRAVAEWHVFVEVTTADREETIYLHLVPRINGRYSKSEKRYVRGQRITWAVTRVTMNAVTRTNVERLGLGHEYSWSDVPLRARRAVLQDLGIEA